VVLLSKGLKGTLWNKVPLLLVAGISSAWVAGFAISTFSGSSGTLCRRSRLDEVQMLAEKISESCERDQGKMRLTYDFTKCLDSVEFRRLPAKTVKEDKEGKGPMGLVANYSGSADPGDVATSCDDFKIYDKHNYQGNTLSLPGRHKYLIVTSALEEEKEGEKIAKIEIVNFAVGQAD